MNEQAIDCWVNVTMGETPPQDWLIRVKEDYFKGGDDFLANISVEQLLRDMDDAGVAKAIVSVQADEPSEHALSFARSHPDRFALAAGVNMRGGMKSIWALEDLVLRNPAVVMARVVPFTYDLPPTHPLFYPLYAKCVELDLPLSLNTGIPGPPQPGDCQNPMYLDRVCLDFPDLRLTMAHGADPWWDVAIRLMLKYRNLRLMTSAWAPRYLPPELIHFMNTRGQDRIMFASDHPVLSFKRCIGEAKALDLRPGVLDKFLYKNAASFFFSPRKPHLSGSGS